MRRETIAPAPMLSPIASVYRIVMNDSVSPTVATASAPRWATTNTSTTTKMLSMSISSTIGTARMKIARPIGPSVKSRPCAPASASRTAPQSDCGGARSGTETDSIVLDMLVLSLNARALTHAGFVSAEMRSPRLRGSADGAMIAPGAEAGWSRYIAPMSAP